MISLKLKSRAPAKGAKDGGSVKPRESAVPYSAPPVTLGERISLFMMMILVVLGLLVLFANFILGPVYYLVYMR